MLRRLDCVLAPAKEAALKEYADKLQAGIAFEPFVKRKIGLDFYNVSQFRSMAKYLQRRCSRCDLKPAIPEATSHTAKSCSCRWQPDREFGANADLSLQVNAS